MKTSAEIREAFLKYFEDRGHKRVRSSSLVPENDPTLLFTNAGMNQFKNVFLGLEKRDYRRATTAQKCMRVSGKHNDLETVGRTARHHTFFEMLGNFSFGDYFKQEAIEFAWDLCTRVYAIPTECLIVTVYEEDDEALKLWRDHIGVPEKRIFQLGAEDNFWAMGDTGPCGPCSELHYDYGRSPAGHVDCSIGCECGRYVEIWNLVFMQFNRDASGRMAALPSPSIDTGMGLERITCVLQGVSSNYDTDLFRPLIAEACRLTAVPFGESEESDVSLRILADHSRSCAFLATDGIVPGNEGRGYVLRKILRRAIRHGRMLGKAEPFLYTLAALAAERMKGAYPELESSREIIARVVKIEEEKFNATLSYGLQLLDEIFARTQKKSTNTLPGDELFKLYDTYGFPLDLVREIAGERGVGIDEAGFQKELEKQRERARASWKGGEKAVKPIYRRLGDQGMRSEFTGYAHHCDTARVLALVRDDKTVEELAEGETGEIVLDRTPFYAEAGGQVADQGVLESETARARVEHVFEPVAGLRLHRTVVEEGRLRKGDSLQAGIRTSARASTAANHTGTHLLHAALREVLGEHVKQAGSLVAPDRLRFDFSHYKPLTAEEIRRIEELVNEKIRANIQIQTEIRSLDEAIRDGAMALFGEKYQDRVRVVQIPGFSMELCGGTHVGRTGDIALFKIVSESGISAGVRRVEAVTGEGALSRFFDDEAVIAKLSDDLHVRRDALPAAVAKMARELKEANKKAEQLRLKLAGEESADAIEQARDVKGIRVVSQKVANLDRTTLRQLADQIKNRLRSGVVVLGSAIDGKVGLVAMVTPDLTDRINASELVRRVAEIVGGGGGGRPEMAEAGGKDPARLSEALDQAYHFIAEMLEVRERSAR